MTDHIIQEINKAVARAKSLWPDPVEPFHRLATITEEVGEVSKELQAGMYKSAVWEAYDAIAVLIRLIEELEEKKLEGEKPGFHSGSEAEFYGKTMQPWSLPIGKEVKR